MKDVLPRRRRRIFLVVFVVESVVVVVVVVVTLVVLDDDPRRRGVVSAKWRCRRCPCYCRTRCWSWLVTEGMANV